MEEKSPQAVEEVQKVEEAPAEPVAEADKPADPTPQGQDAATVGQPGGAIPKMKPTIVIQFEDETSALFTAQFIGFNNNAVNTQARIAGDYLVDRSVWLRQKSFDIELKGQEGRAQMVKDLTRGVAGIDPSKLRRPIR
jgi:hypothetical protein